MWLLLWLGCATTHEVPPYLQPAQPRAQLSAPARPVVDLPSALEELLGGDPLARRVEPGPPGRYAAIPGGGSLEAWAAVARRVDPTAEDLAALERAHRGTPAMALARGTALALLETRLTGAPVPGAPEETDKLLPWIGPFLSDDRPLPPDARDSNAWLGPLDPRDARQALLTIAERRVLLGWLDGPEIPLGPVARLIGPPLYDRLEAEPAGALIAARGRGARDPDAARQGEALLSRATALALTEVAADRDAEQSAWRTQRADLVRELGLGEGDNPVAALLQRALGPLTADAAEDRSAGLGLVALTALRLVGPCPPGVCRDFDRAATLARAELWSPDVVPLARAWQVIALKDAVDAVEVSLERPTFTSALPEVLDALAGTGPAGFPALALRRGRTSQQLFLDVSRGAGGPDQLDGAGLVANLRARLVLVADRALAAPPPPALHEPLTRIRDRAGR